MRACAAAQQSLAHARQYKGVSRSGSWSSKWDGQGVADPVRLQCFNGTHSQNSLVSIKQAVWGEASAGRR